MMSKNSTGYYGTGTVFVIQIRFGVLASGV